MSELDKNQKKKFLKGKIWVFLWAGGVILTVSLLVPIFAFGHLVVGFANNLQNVPVGIWVPVAAWSAVGAWAIKRKFFKRG